MPVRIEQDFERSVEEKMPPQYSSCQHTALNAGCPVWSMHMLRSQDQTMLDLRR